MPTSLLGQYTTETARQLNAHIQKDTVHQATEQWVTAAQRGDPSGFGHLHRRFVALVHGVLLSRFRPAIAEELTQECFLIAFQKLHQLREPAKFGPWIVAIARRVDAVGERRSTDSDDIDEVVDHRASPESTVDAAKVLSAIRQLPEAYRETLVLRLVEGMSGAEIASETGISADSVRVNLHRGIKKLREALAIDVHAETNAND
jgi:RNA polymerase sigma-70 factor, ECF subfamily